MRKTIVLFVLILLTFTDARKKKVPQISPASVDIYPERFDKPVDFGHVYRSGYISDGTPDRDPRDIPIVADYRQVKREPPNPGAIFASPRDKYEYYRRYGNQEVPNQDAVKGRERMWFDFSELLLKNIAKPPEPSRKHIELPNKMQAPILGERDATQEVETGKSQYMAPNSFGLDGVKDNVNDGLNWTTCDEFKVGAKFHPADVLDIQWLPFYIWTTGMFPAAYIHEFERPTQKLVWEYREKYGRYLDKRIDWEQPKLLMRNMNEFLLIAGDKRGLFYIIMHVNIPDHVRDTDMVLPLMSLRLKRQKQYLLMIRCNEMERYIAAMAVVGEGPNMDIEKMKAAQTFHIRGAGQLVERHPDREAALLQYKNQYKAMQNTSSTIRLTRDYGMFPPENYKY